MAVVTRTCNVFPCTYCQGTSCMNRTSQYGWSMKSTVDTIKTQICTIALSITLFNSIRLPKEAFKHGEVPYLVVYTFWLLVVGLPTTFLQLAIGQLSQQDSVGVWRAVPILRGVGHLKMITSFICCIYSTLHLTLALAYLIWIAKGTFPLKDCTRLHITPSGYENKMNATECFNSTFLSPFTEHPHYLGIMAILIFISWFFLPLLLYRLRKSLRPTLYTFTPIVIILTIVLSVFLSKGVALSSLLYSCNQWLPLSEPYIWHSALVQCLMSTQIINGYLFSAGGTLYAHSDVRWTSTLIIITNLLAGWIWVFLWQSISGDSKRDSSMISILILIYQSSVSERRLKQWPLLAFGIVFISGIITVVILLFPIYERIHRIAGDNWRLFAAALSAVGTALTTAVLAKGLDVAMILDEVVTTILAIFTTAIDIVGFVFIYGWSNVAVDVEFLTGSKLPWIWVSAWWTTPVLLLGVTGWWLRSLLRATWGQMHTLWPFVGVFVGILIAMVIIAAITVAKEEQFNFITKISSAFRPSRLWGPEEPMARYMWMSQRYANEVLSHENDSNSEPKNYHQIISDRNKEKIYEEDWLRNEYLYQSKLDYYTKSDNLNKNDDVFKSASSVYTTYTVPKSKKRIRTEDKYRSPNICIAKEELGVRLDCNCNRHFTLNVPTLKNTEVTTSL